MIPLYYIYNFIHLAKGKDNIKSFLKEGIGMEWGKYQTARNE